MAQQTIAANEKDNDPSGNVKAKVITRTEFPQADGSNKEALDVNQLSNQITPGKNTQFIAEYGEYIDMPPDILETLVEYTVPVDKVFRFQRADCDGGNFGEFQLLVDSVIVGRRHTWWTNFQTQFVDAEDSFGRLLVAGQKIEVRFIHRRPCNGDICADIKGLLSDA